MSPELMSILVLLIVSGIALLILDVAVSGLLSLCSSIAFKKAFCRGLWALLLPCLALVYGVLVERNCYSVKEVTLAFQDLPAGFDGYRIVHLSDIHSRSFRHRKKSLQRAIDKVNAQNADLIAFTGDLVTITPEELEVSAPYLRQLSAKDGVVSVIGNHDYGKYMDAEQLAALSRTPLQLLVDKECAMGWNVLLNENQVLRRGKDSICIIGVENTSTSKYFPSTGDLPKAMEGTDGLFKILLSHDPTQWEKEVIGQDIALTLSGHTHAAQFSVFGFSPSRFLFKQYRGLYEKGRQKLYVNIGLGETIVPLRIGTAPEITVITLKKSR